MTHELNHTGSPTSRFFGAQPTSNQGQILNLAGSGRSNIMDISRLFEFNRKDRPLGFFENILSRQGGIESMVDQFKNPFTGRITEGLEEAQGQVRGLRGQFDSIGDDLRSSALARTQGSQVAALNAARLSSGRGGLAFGGGARNVATRAAREAATQQSGSLAQALLQGRQMKTQFNLQQASLETNIGSLLAQSRSRQAGLAESNFNRRLGVRQNLQQIIASLAGATGRPSAGGQATTVADITGIIQAFGGQ